MSAAPEKAVVFRCQGEDLVGVVHPSAGRRTGVLIVVGGPQYRVGSHRQFVLMARALAEAGHPVFRFDYRGMGDSGGSLRTFEHVAEDVRTAIDTFAKQVPDLQSIAIWGLCDAASAALMYCASDSRVSALILANPWVRTDAAEAQSYIRHYYLRRFLQRSFWTKVLSGGFDVRASLGDLFAKLRAARAGAPAQGANASASEAAHQAAASGASSGNRYIDRMLDGLRSFGRPVLFLISGRDLTAAQFTDLTRSSKPWARAMSASGVETESFPTADHTFSARGDLDRVSAVCVRWLEKLQQADVATNRAGRSASANVVPRSRRVGL
jgi:exosortase A-associated hydrolase 1